MYKLRELERRDITAINNWRNDEALISCLGAPFRYINCETDMKWYDSYMQSRNNTVRCAITEEDDNILGLISLTGIDYVHGSATLHIMIGNVENRGHGMGSFAVKKMLEHAFDNLNLHRVELGVLDNNAVALKLYKKIGFIEEGRKRSAFFKNGCYMDLIIMGLLSNEYHHS